MSNKEIKVSAKVISHAISEEGVELICFSLTYGLMIHAEMCRHREQSRSVMSNRAIPAKVIRGEVLKHPYVPVFIGKNKAGMVAGKACGSWAKTAWKLARYPVCAMHWIGEKLGVHKETLNRLLFPWQWVRESVTANSFDNFYNLRIHPDAQQDIKAIAEVMYEAKQQSKPHLLKAGEWFVPYVDTIRKDDGVLRYIVEGKEVSSDVAIKCSAARVARSSYNNHDKTGCTLEADLKLYHQLIVSEPAHASPVEVQCTPIIKAKGVNNPNNPNTWSNGITHVRKNGQLCSGNMVGWIQSRQLLDNHTCYKYNKQ